MSSIISKIAKLEKQIKELKREENRLEKQLSRVRQKRESLEYKLKAYLRAIEKTDKYLQQQNTQEQQTTTTEQTQNNTDYF